MTDEQKKLLKSAMLGFEKTLGEGVFYDIKNQPKSIDRWKLSSPALNYVFGGGLPKGRIIELYGKESHGKTLVATVIAADVQKQGGMILYIDAENGFDFDFAEVFGLSGESENFILAKPDCAEDAMDLVEKLSETGALDLVIIDSIAALSPKAEMAGTNSDQQMGALARVLSKAFRKMVAKLARSNTTLLCINQIREKIGGFSPNGPAITTPGGNALKFYASIRAQVAKKEDIKAAKGEDLLGLLTEIRIKKNKTSLSGRTAELAISFTEGMDYLAQYVGFGIDRDIDAIKKTGGTWYEVGGERVNGRAKLIEILREPHMKAAYEEIKDQVEKTFVIQKIELIEKPEQIKKGKKAKDAISTITADGPESIPFGEPSGLGAPIHDD